MFKTCIIFISIFSATLAQASLTDQQIIDSCFRGTSSSKIWMDSANVEFVQYFRSLGYDNMEALGASYKICRDVKLKGKMTDEILSEAASNANKKRVESYVADMRTAIESIISTCRPGQKCYDQPIYIPLEGVQNDNSVCHSPAPTFWNGIPICKTGSSNRIWIDRPTIEFVRYLTSEKKYGIMRALGVAYRVCRGVDTAKASVEAISGVMHEVLSKCPSSVKSCNVSYTLPLEGQRNRTVPVGFNCGY